MEELDHETSESLERPRYPDGGIDFNENTLGCVNVYLQPSSFVDGRIKKSQEALDRGLAERTRLHIAILMRMH